ncbi:iron-containing redox enzyme family protein [Dolichospermum circinale CS-1225]|uniref:iron-containing redox enzyme family protein n=1 Tax=Dolichospermum circinale TaxID=109265 RepID=UPI000421FADA|nr:iron-containing redox enzyme family protein [Dolichospermum circinale]MDB9456912.1 iron-containing redox enzyme family protein [Dolichospermum circinale CS-545/17]MDB9466497.1 iron-containing redox enzyme family protein [Dolichospermum circinale CS-539/09]MDB9472044.1 iron-containing redox enzyme family protein [Dolichospermum circinale CS-539]MDB9522897.1 iron-containing redox enzyme family protein [Dolichospermum circinale CS-1225]
MMINSSSRLAIASTSSRLDRETELPPIAKAQMELISTKAIDYCHEALDRSRFFNMLKDGVITPSIMQYAFLQYHHWRDRLHQWFGLCIVKAKSCLDPDQKAVIMALADHTFTDLQDGHSEMFVEFLEDLGVSDAVIAASQPSPASLYYGRSFFDDFGYDTDNFYEAVAALSGRELCVAIRNRIILKFYFDARGMKPPKWLALHAELEVEHFHDAIRPVLTRYAENAVKIADLMKAIECGIDRHMQYFEEMLHEYESQN